MKRLRALTGAAAAVTVGVAFAMPSAQAATGTGELDPSLTPINLINTNDFHGHFSKDYACTVVTAENELPGSVFMSAGDNVGGTPFESASQQDEPSIDFLNSLGLQVSSVGNHEFDHGFEDLTGRISKHADWTYLGANVYKKGTTTPALPAYKILDVDGLKVGIIGAVTEDVPSLVAKPGIAKLSFGDPVDAVNKVAKKLKSSGAADVLVAEYHEGAPAGGDGVTLEEDEANSPVFRKIVQKTDPSIAAIFTGHTHQLYAFDAPVPGGSGTRPVIQTDFYAQYLGVVQLGYNKETGKVEQYTVGNREVTEPTKACANDATYKAAAKIVDDANKKAAKIGKQPIGKLTGPITTAYDEGQRDDRMRESTLSNAIAQSYVDSMNAPGRVGGVQIGVMNPGGVRADLLATNDNVITYADAATIMPFNNTMQTADLTGAQFKKVLEQQWQPKGQARPFLNLGLSENVTYTFDPDAEDGSHITSVMVDGKPLDPKATYTVASNSFLVAGGDNFTEFANATNVKDSGLIDQSLFMEWIKSHSPLSPNFAKLGVAVQNQPKSVTAGDTISFTVSGLDLTSLGSPTTTSVEVSLAGEDLGSFPVTKVLTDAPPYPTRNESAKITVTVPADAAAGAANLVVKAPQTGTTVTMPVTVNAGTAPTSTTTGPPIITDGSETDGGNSGVLVGGGLALLLVGVGAVLLRRRV